MLLRTTTPTIQTVAALRDARQAGHEQAWQQWMHQALLILRRAGLAWSSDQAVDSDDLAQIARAELVRALPSYRYQSRLFIWANRVVVQIARRHLRDSRRSKARGPARLARPAGGDRGGPAGCRAGHRGDRPYAAAL